MINVGLDAIVLTSPSNVYYLSGMDTENTVDPLVLVISGDGPPLLVVNAFERGRVENTVWTENVHYYSFASGAVDVVVAAVRSLGLGSSPIGIEQRSSGLAPAVFVALAQELRRGGADIRDPHGVVEECRRRKSTAELGLMRRAGLISARGMAAGCASMKHGCRDYEVGAAIVEAIYRGGSDLVCWGPIVAVGYRAGAPHCSFNGRRLEAGDTVFLELTAEVRRYTAPLMCTAVIGPPTRALERIADAGRRAIESALENARPGLPASVVARSMDVILRPVREEYGLYMPDRYGYSVGIGFPPTWEEDLGYFIRTDNEEPLQPGMTFHLPISLRRYGEFGINQSATIAITETGAEALTLPPPDLHIIETSREGGAWDA
jgi:Xaa-Pro dipeptidase